MRGPRRFYRGVAVEAKNATEVERGRTHLRLARDRLTGRLSAQLVAQQPVHVGSGALLPPEVLGLDAPGVPLVKAFARRGDERIIPGSSLKGAFRSLVELFTYACVCKTRVFWKGGDKEDYGECRYRSKQHRGELCPACKLFGAMGYQGQVRFEDAPQRAGGNALYLVPPQYPPRADRNYRRYYPHGLVDDRVPSWPLEVATCDARFALHAQFTNLSEAELGLLLIALGQGVWALCPKVGAGKSSGLGAVKIEDLTVERWQIDFAYQTFDSAGAWRPVDVEACMEAAQSLIRPDVLDDLARDLACKVIPEARDAGDD